MNNITSIYEYTTEGAPLLIGDLTSIDSWRGSEPDTKGIIVEYMGRGVDKLPNELLQVRQQGRQTKKFKTLAEANVFEQKVIKALQTINPKAERPTRYPDHPGFYEGNERIFSVEKRFSSAFSNILKRLKKPLQRLSLDGKRSGEGLFFEQEDGGRGWLFCAESGFAIAKVHEQEIQIDQLKPIIEQIRIVDPLGTMHFDGRFLIFDSSYSAQELSEVNWGNGKFKEIVAKVFETSEGGPLSVRDQQLPCVAFVRLPAGEYAYTCVEFNEPKHPLMSVCILSRV